MPLADSSSSFADAALPSSAAAVAAMAAAPQPLSQLAEGLETPIQLIYLLTLLGFLSVGAYLVVRQVHTRAAACVPPCERVYRCCFVFGLWWRNEHRAACALCQCRVVQLRRTCKVWTWQWTWHSQPHQQWREYTCPCHERSKAVQSRRGAAGWKLAVSTQLPLADQQQT